jgi:hypothetical protein
VVAGLAATGKFSTRIENNDGQVFEVRLAAVRDDGAEASGLYMIIRDTEAMVDGAMQQWTGPLYWVWAVWGFALVIAGVGLHVARCTRLPSRRERRRGMLLAAIVLAPRPPTTTAHRC